MLARSCLKSAHARCLADRGAERRHSHPTSPVNGRQVPPPDLSHRHQSWLGLQFELSGRRFHGPAPKTDQLPDQRPRAGFAAVFGAARQTIRADAEGAPAMEAVGAFAAPLIEASGRSPLARPQAVASASSSIAVRTGFTRTNNRCHWRPVRPVGRSAGSYLVWRPPSPPLGLRRRAAPPSAHRRSPPSGQRPAAAAQTRVLELATANRSRTTAALNDRAMREAGSRQLSRAGTS